MKYLAILDNYTIDLDRFCLCVFKVQMIWCFLYDVPITSDLWGKTFKSTSKIPVKYWIFTLEDMGSIYVIAT